eukprot:15011093-Alexandrium_andersonii.AAC.1
MNPAASRASNAWPGSSRSQSTTPTVSTSHAETTASQPRPVGGADAVARERWASQSLSGFQSRAAKASGR